MGYGWSGSSAATYTITSTNTAGFVYPASTYTGRLVLNDVQIEPPVPQTEVEKLLREVEDVCALAR